MVNKSISLALLLVAALIAPNIVIVQAIPLEAMPKPSIPEFTVKLVSHPYDVAPVTTTIIDQYTGKQTTTTQPGYHVENKSIEINIKNPQFTPINVTEYTPVWQYWYEGDPKPIQSNHTTNLYYKVQVKGHFGNDWTTPQITYPSYSYSDIPAQLSSEYTLISCNENYPMDAQIDFQVQALTGFYLPYGRNILIFGYEFYGKESDWNIQTLNMADGSVTTTPYTNEAPASSPTPTTTLNPTPTPTVPEFSITTLLPLLVALPLVAIMLLRKKKSQSQHQKIR